MDNLSINPNSAIPKYLQLVTAIKAGVNNGVIAKDQLLPSLHELCIRLEISKNTAEKAYNILKKQGVVGSFRGKGYFIV